MALTLVHVCGFIWEWTLAKYKSPLNTPGGIWGGGLGCHKFKSLVKLSNGWNDWHQIWHTSADPSRNGYTPNKLPLETQGGGGGTWGGGFRGQTCNSLGKLSNGWTDWHQPWFTSADSSENGHRLNTISPTMPQGHFGGFRGGGDKFKCLGKLSNGWTDCHQIWCKSADLDIWEWT